MEPRIEFSSKKKFIGKRLTMSFADNKTSGLWKSFIGRQGEIINKLSSDLISLQVYPPNHFMHFNPNDKFEKWAAVEVSDFDNVPVDLDTFILTEGLYAVFEYKGLSTDYSIFRYIFSEWLPGSDYLLDDRPHFEVLGTRYRNNDPSSEEEIWIPVKEKSSYETLVIVQR